MGEMFQSAFCIGYRAKVTPFWRKLLGFVITDDNMAHALCVLDD
jgi:hypothetical protein